MSNVTEHAASSRLLIVEDELSIIFALREFFSNEGYVVDFAASVPESERLLAGHEYAVVIVDVHLTPNRRMEGLELVRLAQERCRSTRAIVLTAYGSANLEREARQSGADAFFAKPVPLPLLASTVERFVSEARG